MKSIDQMNIDIEEVYHSIPIGTTWQHYKGSVYIVRGYSISTVNEDVLVRHTKVAGPGFVAIEESFIEYARPAKEWHNRLMANTPRFRRLNSASDVRVVDAPVRD